MVKYNESRIHRAVDAAWSAVQYPVSMDRKASGYLKG